MELYLIRHAPAGDPHAFADDTLRPLTDSGREAMRRGVQGLHRQGIAFDAVATSPLLRARQTAELIEEGLGSPLVLLDDLRPEGRPERVLAWVVTAGCDSLALVGHAPDLGRLGAWLITGSAGDFLKLKKGGVCCLRFDESPRAGGGRLEWLLTPAQLRRLG